MVQPPRPGGVIDNKVGLLQNPQVLGDCGAADREPRSQFPDRLRAGEQAVQDSAPGGISESVELCRLVSRHLR